MIIITGGIDAIHQDIEVRNEGQTIGYVTSYNISTAMTREVSMNGYAGLIRAGTATLNLQIELNQYPVPPALSAQYFMDRMRDTSNSTTSSALPPILPEVRVDTQDRQLDSQL